MNPLENRAGSNHLQRSLVRQAENVFKQPHAGHHARDTLNREKHQNHHCSQDAQQVGLGRKLIGEVVARPMSNQPLMSEAPAGSAVTKLPRLRPPTTQSS